MPNFTKAKRANQRPQPGSEAVRIRSKLFGVIARWAPFEMTMFVAFPQTVGKGISNEPRSAGDKVFYPAHSVLRRVEARRKMNPRKL